MTRGRNTWRKFVAALIVATGLAIVWALVCIWTGTLTSAFVAGEQIREDIQVAADGTPVITANSNRLMQSVALSRRTLDGKSFPVSYEHWLGSAYLPPRLAPPGLVNVPRNWAHSRIIGGTDGRRPPAAWYLVRDDEPAGHAHLVGVDAFSKLPVGYISRAGFRESPPDASEYFALPAANEFQVGQYIATRQYFSGYGVVWEHSLPEQGVPAAWLVYLAEADQLWEIDLRQRSARIVSEVPHIVATSMCTVLETTAHPPAEAKQTRQRRESPFRLTAANLQQPALFEIQNTFVPSGGYSIVQLGDKESAEDEPKYASVLAIRTDEKLVMFDPPTGKKVEFPLPAETADKQITVTWVAPEQALVDYTSGEWSGGTITKLFWINPQGEVERQEEVKLAGSPPDDPRRVAWFMSPVVPAPVAWLVGMVLAVPMGMLQSNFMPTYGAALDKVFAIGWPPLVAVLAVSAILAWITWRLQRKYHRSATGLWTVFTFLLGLPGLVAYLLEHRRAKLESCPSCGQVVPRDRDACAACATQFPVPPLVGTEILA